MKAKCHPELEAFIGVLCSRCYRYSNRLKYWKTIKAKEHAAYRKNPALSILQYSRRRGKTRHHLPIGASLTDTEALTTIQSYLDNVPDRCSMCESRRRLVLDHDHSTGVIRGWVCSKCNIDLGKYENNLWQDRMRVWVQSHREGMLS